MAKNVLIVEDEKSLQRILAKKLAQQPDWHIFQAFNGQEGLAIVEKEPIDLILLDIVMPVMDGLAMLEELKKTDKLSQIKVIILTNSASFEKAFKDERVSYLVKSNHTLEELVELIRQEMSKS